MKKGIIYILFLLNLGLILFFWWQISGQLLLTNPGADMVFVVLGRIAGLLAVYLILIQFLMIGRTKWLEKIFGLDKLSRTHHWFGVAAIFLIIFHLGFLLLGYAPIYSQTLWQQFVDFNLHYENVFPATLAFFLFGFIVLGSITIARKQFKYETWYYVHLATYLAVILAFGHQLEIGGDLNGSVLFTAYWVLLYIFIFANFIIYRFLLPLYNFYKHRFYVREVKKETEDAVSIYMGGKNIEDFKYQAGQFVIVRFLTRKFFKEAHPYTISIEPGQDYIRITPKNLGDFSGEIKNIETGAKILIDGPHGVFTKKPNQGDKILFIAGGVGITPLRALSSELLKEKKDIILLYSTRDKENIILKKELEKLAQENVANFKIYYIIKGEHFDHGFERIDEECIKCLVEDIREREAYICGPPFMMRAMKKYLINLGVNKHKIYYEKFSL